MSNGWATDNGCTCRHLHPEQTCISCRARAACTEKCKRCDVGLFAGDEADRRTCSNCYYDMNPGVP